MSSTECISERAQEALSARTAGGLLRRLAARPADPEWLNLADNDYLGLAHDPEVISGAMEATRKWGASAGASPLITGFTQLHAELERALAGWHGYQHGLVWNSGFAANSAALGLLLQRGDVVLADRLIHASMVAGIVRSGARLRRFPHNDLHALQAMLAEERLREGAIFVVTESIFSMDGDGPDLGALAEMREEFEFFWVLDEAHATGWFGETGAGALEAQGCLGQPDLLVSTLGKALGSQGAYTLFRDGTLREWLLNEAPEFVYSTYLAPPAAGAALTALKRVREILGARTALPKDRQRKGTDPGRLDAVGDTQPPTTSIALPSEVGAGVDAPGQPETFNPLELSRSWRAAMREAGAKVPEGDSAIVPVPLGPAQRAENVQRALLERGFRVSCIRPPTVPDGTARLRVSLRRGLTEEQRVAFAAALKEALSCA